MCVIIISCYANITQLVECQPSKLKVASSSLVVRSILSGNSLNGKIFTRGRNAIFE